MNQPIYLSTLDSIIWVLIGIIISLIFPVAVRMLREAAKKKELEKPSFWQRLVAAWNKYGGKKYLMYFLAAVFVAIVLVFLLGLKFLTARDAAIGGFAWESLVNKLYGASKG